MKRFAGFALDIPNQCLWLNGAQLTLPPKPFALLRYLVENPGRLVTHDELLEALWPETFVQPQVLRTYVLELRKLLGDDARQPRFIQSLPKRGYCFVATITDDAQTDNIARAEEGSPEFVGRNKELASLRALFQLAHDGRRQIVFLAGDSGMGKTALVDCFCRSFGPNVPVTIARGQCVQGVARREEYYPIMEALAGLCASPYGDHACEILARLAPAWLGALGRPIASAPTLRAPGELCAALEEIAVQRPLVLVFDDLHLADESTLGLISALARRRAPARILLLALVNSQHPATEHPLRVLKQDLAVRRQCAEITLEPLGKTAVCELLAAILAQQAVPADLDGFVHRHSEGNPLFVLALVKHLMTQGLLIRNTSGDQTSWDLSMPVNKLEPAFPDELAQMIELEIQTLSAMDQTLVEAASLFTVAFPAWGVAAALDEDPAAVEESCDALARRLSFVRRAGYDELPGAAPSAFYVFAHGIYREVLYQRQAPARRAERHNRIAHGLATLFAGREALVAREMATHYEAAGNWPSAIRALQSAAQFAVGLQSLGGAVIMLQDALRITRNLPPLERAAVVRVLQQELAAVTSDRTASSNC